MSKIKIIFLLVLLLAVGTCIVYFILPPRLSLSFPSEKCHLTVNETFEEKLAGFEVRETRQSQNDEWELVYAKPEENRQSFVMTLQGSERWKTETAKDTKPIELHFDSRKQKLEDVFSKEDIAGYLPALDMPLLIILQNNKIVGIEQVNPEGDTPERKEKAKRRAAGKSVPVQKFCFLYMDQIDTLLPPKRVRPQEIWNKDISLYTSWGEMQIGVQCELIRFVSRDNRQVAVVQYRGVSSGKTCPFVKINTMSNITQSFNLQLNGEYEIEVKSGWPLTHTVSTEIEHVYTTLTQMSKDQSTEKKSEADRTITATIKEKRILTWEPEKTAESK